MKPVCVLVFVFGLGVLGLQTQSDMKPSGQTSAPKPQSPAKPVIPDTFTNLQVLPKEIEKPDLMTIMKGFCLTFKVRCSHCHVATDDLSSADFPSDEKPTKQNARELLRNLNGIQLKYSEGFRPSAK